MNAKERRWREFLECRSVTVKRDERRGTICVDSPHHAEPIPIAHDALYAALQKQFEGEELLRQQAISDKRREAGRKGAKIAGRGRPKKKSA